METESTSTKKEHTSYLATLTEVHDKALAEVGEQFKSKLIVEYQKYDNLEDDYNNSKKSNEKQMKEMANSTKGELKKMQADFNTKLAANDIEASLN